MLRFATAIATLFVALPLLLIVATSFNANSNFVFPPEGFSLRWYQNMLTRPEFGRGLVLSLQVAAASAALGLAAGTAAAVAIVRYRFPGRAALNALIMAPLVVPEVVMGLSLLIWLQGAAWAPGSFRILLLHCLVVLPYVTRIMVANLQRVDPTLEEAARLLGAPPLTAFVRVTLPVIGKGLGAAAIFALVMSFHNFTATFFIAGSQQTLPVAVFQYIRSEHDPTIAALTTVLILGAGVIVWITDRFLGLDRIAK